MTSHTNKVDIIKTDDHNINKLRLIIHETHLIIHETPLLQNIEDIAKGKLIYSRKTDY